MNRLLLLLTMKPNILVGGQAVIEGVMMRVPGAYSTAVRDPKGKIQLKRQKFRSITENSTIWSMPILRGIASLYEAMKMGMETLQWSADITYPEENSDSHTFKVIGTIITLFLIFLAISLFMVLPMWLSAKLLFIDQEALFFNIIAG